MRLHKTRIALCLPLIGCLNTDFGRVRPTLRSDDIHRWMGPAVTERYGEAESAFPLTDPERTLRDLGYPLIEPPYERQRWYSVLNEYGLSGYFLQAWWTYDQTAYAAMMFADAARSTETYYARLLEDIRNDNVRIGPFAMVARQVSDMDVKRDKSLRYVSNLNPREHGNAVARMAENSLIARWVHQSLMERTYAYNYALEKLVIVAPSPQAAEVERQLNRMRMNIVEAGLVPRGSIGPWVTKAAGPLVTK
ncbi:MAG: hypothetical protein AB7V13_28710 [Pseudorhodoplanes sp.]|uniref:hypothetical protein n=1 Tax=Pseudorhodoplanes sp. TaxID=1934341 RepID=UPI003D10762A